MNLRQTCERIVSSWMLNLGTGWEERSASNPCCFSPRKTVLFSHWIGGSMDPVRCLDALERNVSCLCWESKSDSLSFVTYYLFLIVQQSLVDKSLFFIKGLRSHSDITFGGTTLDKRLECSKEIYGTTHNTDKRQSSMHRHDPKS
jgi:hypothetical protein